MKNQLNYFITGSIIIFVIQIKNKIKFIKIILHSKIKNKT